MRFPYQRPDALIICLCIAWIAILGGLGLSAIIFESFITKRGVHIQDLGAVVLGCFFIGCALIGFLPFLATNPFRRLITALVFAGWLAGSIIYLLLH